MNIYIVTGECGSYSEHCTWSVKAYRREEEAKAHAEAANKWMIDNKNKIERQEYNTLLNPFNPTIKGWISEDTYFGVEAISLEDTFIESDFVQHVLRDIDSNSY